MTREFPSNLTCVVAYLFGTIGSSWIRGHEATYLCVKITILFSSYQYTHGVALAFGPHALCID